MAKLAFSKLNLKKNTEKKTLVFNDQEIEIEQYLPIEDRIKMVEDIVNRSVDDNGYYNPIRLKIFTVLGIVMTYTNISFTEKQKEDGFKLFDLIVGNGLWEVIENNIPKAEIDDTNFAIKDLIESVYKFKNSAAGMVKSLATDYDNTSFDLDKISEQISDPQALGLVKELLNKMG